MPDLLRRASSPPPADPREVAERWLLHAAAELGLLKRQA